MKPFRIEPQGGQVSENDVDSSNKERADVFHEDEAGSYFANEASVLSPEPGLFSFDAFAEAGVRDVGAGEPAAEEIHAIAKGPAVEGSHVRPYRARSQATLFHARKKDGARIGVPLHESDRAKASADSLEGKAESEFESGRAGEEADAGELASGRTGGRFFGKSHIHFPSR